MVNDFQTPRRFGRSFPISALNAAGNRRQRILNHVSFQRDPRGFHRNL
jgi:hypothetical protein